MGFTVLKELLHRMQDLVVPGVLARFLSELELVVEMAAQTWWKI